MADHLNFECLKLYAFKGAYKFLFFIQFKSSSEDSKPDTILKEKNETFSDFVQTAFRLKGFQIMHLMGLCLLFQPLWAHFTIKS